MSITAESSQMETGDPKDGQEKESKSPWILVLQEFIKNKRAVVSLVLLILIGVATIVVPWISPHSYSETFYAHYDGASAPDAFHWFGIDSNYRDLMVRCFIGGRVSFAVGFLATAVAIVIGVAYGSIAGYFGGAVDMVMMRIVDILYGLPYMMLVIIAMAVFQSRSFLLVFLVLGLFSWLTMSRIVRGEVLSLKETEFVLSAQSLGANTFTILTRHIIPNLVGPVVVYATLTVPRVMLSEAFLSFLGLGISEPMTSWGKLISEGAAAMSSDYIPWWMIVFPGALFSMTLYCLNTVGDGIRDAFDVREYTT